VRPHGRADGHRRRGGERSCDLAASSSTTTTTTTAAAASASPPPPPPLQASLGLDLPELEATVRALKRYGNSSSASFLFAFGELLDHPPATIHAHDPGAFITMGPGAGVELCLWSAGPRAVTSEAVPLSGWEPASLLPVRSSLVERVAQPM